jgi:hypothetical protein
VGLGHVLTLVGCCVGYEPPVKFPSCSEGKAFLVKAAEAEQLLLDLKKAAAETKQEFAYCSLLCFAPEQGCGLHISSLIPPMWSLEFLRDLVGRGFEPLAIIGIPTPGKLGRIIKLYPQEGWPDLDVYIENAISGEQHLMLGFDPRHQPRVQTKPRLL